MPEPRPIQADGSPIKADGKNKAGSSSSSSSSNINGASNVDFKKQLDQRWYVEPKSKIGTGSSFSLDGTESQQNTIRKTPSSGGGLAGGSNSRTSPKRKQESAVNTRSSNVNNSNVNNNNNNNSSSSSSGNGKNYDAYDIFKRPPVKKGTALIARLPSMPPTGDAADVSLAVVVKKQKEESPSAAEPMKPSAAFGPTVKLPEIGKSNAVTIQPYPTAESNPMAPPPTASRAKSGTTKKSSTQASDDVESFIGRMKLDKSFKFVYLTPRCKRSSPEYNPYDLKIVQFADIDRTDYYTLSTEGVTHFFRGEAEFVSLDVWLRERKNFYKMIRIPFFSRYRVWKGFRIWRQNVRFAKSGSARSFLEKSLFNLDPVLSKSLCELRGKCVKIMSHRMMNLDKIDLQTFDLEAFHREQRSLLEFKISPLLQEFEKECAVIVDSACRDSLQSSGFYLRVGESEKSQLPPVLAIQKSQDPNQSLTYTEQASRRKTCNRLLRFVKLADYYVVNALHSMAVGSAKELFRVVFKNCGDSDILLDEGYRFFKDLVDNFLTSAVVAKPKFTDADEDYLAPKEPQALFRVELVLSGHALEFRPSHNEFNNVIDALINSFVVTVEKFNLASPTVSYLFAGDRFDDNPFAEGPRIGSIVQDDPHFIYSHLYTKGALRGNFKHANDFMNSLEHFRQMHIENMSADFSNLRNPNINLDQMDQVLDFFEIGLAKYYDQKSSVSGMAATSKINNLLIDVQKLKQTLIPSPTRCFQMLSEIFPVLSRQRNEALLNRLNRSVKILTYVPQSIESYVEFLDHLTETRQSLDAIDRESEQVNRAYALMEKYRITIPPTDLAFFQSLPPTRRQLKEAVDQAEEVRDERVAKFSIELDKNTNEISIQVTNLRNRSQDPVILNSQSKPEDVMKIISELVKEMEALAKTVSDFKSYEQRFNLNLTRHVDIEETKSELMLKRMMWTASQDWAAIVQKWRGTFLEAIITEEMNAQVLNYSKILYQLEKGLPPNDVVPKFRKSVEEIRSIYPTIVDLRNASLKPRHWERIQESTGKNISKEEPVTLEQMFEMRLFDFRDSIGAISAQASSEAALEEMLAKVSKVWSETEFTVAAYRDYKDVFILGSIDDIQTQLEDSQITLAIIKGSRHIGPIKTDVERWDKQLSLFAATLDAWMECQKGWLYLESIFSAPDIQRQLPDEAKMFSQVDRSWKEIMRRTSRNPNAIKVGTATGLLETLQMNNSMLEKIQKCLEDYLEGKRLLFPRFYFLSNDELLEILSQTRNPLAVQPHISKCFDGIKSLEFQSEKGIDILAMISPEGERMPFIKPMKARGNVEAWLAQVEEYMFTSVRKAIKAALGDYDDANRSHWLLHQNGQSVLAVTQLLWCKDVTECLLSAEPLKALERFRDKCIANLAKVAALVRGNLTKLQRAILSALITLEVHSRDIVQTLINSSTKSVTDFQWNMQLRYYWETHDDELIVRMTSASYRYGNEYLGCSPRLVITPLTDRCYLTLTSALSFNLGGSPVGPAGTGKTETVKDLSKALARQCVVYNCGETLDYKTMGKMFAGLAQSGAWICFDEFNRIDIEVLSVVAQQILAIKNAKDANIQRFMLEGREIRLIPSCAAFITMNPGYAGRSELPDNLKALFRPIAMMIPDYGLIAEIILFSEGFEQAKILSRKVVNMYKLCNEQLSQQDHYDFGMRAVKSVLVMAGQMKRANVDLSEEVVLIRALRDSNLPKFIAEDIPLFQGILRDLFPGVEVPRPEYGDLLTAIREEIDSQGLEPVPAMLERILQLYDTLRVRHGVMLVGPTGGGKTTSYEVLAKSLTRLRENKHFNQDYQNVQTFVLNPKSITMAELYGEYNLATMEWKDGLIGSLIRSQVSDSSLDEKWTICDGPVDALWIENMNSVLDDNKLLCLANAERIKLTNSMRMIFEVGDLSAASPATVSRCGMVYMDPSNLGWKPYVKKWIRNLPRKITPEVRAQLQTLFDGTVDKGLHYIRKNCREHLQSVNINLVVSLCRLLKSFLMRDDSELKLSANDGKGFLGLIFCFSYVWSIGGNLVERSKEMFDTFCRELFQANEITIPSGGLVYGFYLDFKTRHLSRWEEIVPLFKYEKGTPYFQMIIPTVDTVRYSYLIDLLSSNGFPILLSGTTGVGKSVIVQELLNRKSHEKILVPSIVNFSAQTTSIMTQQAIESRLEKKRKNVLGAPLNTKVAIFIDDLNMPKVDSYGSQPPIELLRQLLDAGGFYDREKLFWKNVQDTLLIAACSPPGGGRSSTSPRLLRHFTMLNIPKPSDVSLNRIFRSITDGFFKNFSMEVKGCSDAIVNSAVEIYNRICTDILPTPTKSHYTFNLRDLSKVIQGMLQAKSVNIQDRNHVVRLFCHESARVFHDRLTDEADRKYFNQLLSDTVSKNFMVAISPAALTEKPILFGDFLKKNVPAEDRIYTEIEDAKPFTTLLEEYLEEFNVITNQEMRLIFFSDAKQHITRISRIIRQPRGNCLLVGVGGTGKQSLTKLACHIADYKCVQIGMSRSYGFAEWRDDIKNLYKIAGVENKNVVLLITDAQIKSEAFLEDINNILNTGEVPNLFEVDERERILGSVRIDAKEKGSGDDRDSVFQFFINRVRDNLHIVFATSPVGDTFRNRCRMFPSLVNCSTIDWFDEWPQDALLSVARRFFEFVDLGKDDMREKLSMACVEVHSNVSKLSKKFYLELRRRNYTTPTSYLELINLYLAILSEKRKEIGSARDKLLSGLKKLADTNQVVAVMQEELQKLGPELVQKSADVEGLMQQIAKDQQAADAVKKVVSEEEEVVRNSAEETQLIAEEAQRDLNEALPALEAAYKALDALDKKDITEMKAFSKPPEMVVTVMESICVLFKVKPDWDSSKRLLGDSQFLKKLSEFDKDNIPDAVSKKLRKYTEMPAFTAENVEKVSKAAKSLCMWVLAIDLYSQVFKDVQPKRQRLQEAQDSLQITKAKLQEKQDSLKEIEKQLQLLKQKYNESLAEKKQLAEKTEECARRLERASKLTIALHDEEVRWTQSAANCSDQMDHLIGDVFLSAACVAYFGAFTTSYRQQLVSGWIESCEKLEIPVSHNFQLSDILADQVQIRDWQQQGLPGDTLSVENGILVTRGRRWPLIIDPQGQANRWIRKKEGSQLRILKVSDPKFLRTLENAIRIGQPVMLEDVGETLDPALEPLLLKQVVRQGGRLLLKLGDSFVEYDRNFRLYLTTKMANPHYMPEVCIKVTIINFTVTPVGLEGQLLADVVKIERPELEEQRDKLIINLSNDKKQLKDIEEKILKMLNASQGNILDDEGLIQALNQSKSTSNAILERVKLSEETEREINVARERYRPVALRGSVLYFTTTKLAEIDPMYQFSLRYFKNLFIGCIHNTATHEDFSEHISALCSNFTRALFFNVSRAIFEQHKMMFSFMMCTEIMRETGKITPDEWKFFLRGGGLVSGSPPSKPNAAWLTENAWKGAFELSRSVEAFSNLLEEILGNSSAWEGYLKSPAIFEAKLPIENDLTDFQRLLLIKSMCEDKLIASLYGFISRNLGEEFVIMPPFDIAKAFQDTSSSSPLIFILSVGSDPVATFTKFAREKEYSDKLTMISLGQGQGPVAENLIKRAVIQGSWVFLQNCHLAASWMPKLEAIMKDLAAATEENGSLVGSTSGIGLTGQLHPEFRLFLSSMPSKVFPISVLQDGVKITNEPPKGLRANLVRVFNEFSAESFDQSENAFKKLAFGLCFFNAMLHERKKFGPLGWNINYDWSSSDLEVSVSMLRHLLHEEQNGGIPWQALTYMTGEIAFGGRVTDEWDRRCLRSILSRFYSANILREDYRFSESGIYYAPSADMTGVRAYIESLPLTEQPEIFGMHENANISYQIQEAKKLVRTVLETQPRVVAAAGGKTSEEEVIDIAESIIGDWPDLIAYDLHDINNNPVAKALFEVDSNGRMLNSLSTVLLQETDRFNKLISTVKRSLETLIKAIKGLVVMSPDLEAVFRSLLNNEVPSAWAHVAYPSLKPLGSWVKDLSKRVQFIRTWMNRGQPQSFWISGFFFPQGFLTGTLQNHARKYNIPIDTLSFSFEVLDWESTDDYPASASALAAAQREDGVVVRGLFIEGGRWSRQSKSLQDSLPLEMYSSMPLIRFIPKDNYTPQSNTYVCPVYKTSARAGTLSSTGLSTNFVVSLHLTSDKPPEYWIAKGLALLCSLND